MEFCCRQVNFSRKLTYFYTFASECKSSPDECSQSSDALRVLLYSNRIRIDVFFQPNVRSAYASLDVLPSSNLNLCISGKKMSKIIWLLIIRNALKNVNYLHFYRLWMRSTGNRLVVLGHPHHWDNYLITDVTHSPQ